MVGGYIQFFSVLLLVYVSCGLCKGYIQFFSDRCMALCWELQGSFALPAVVKHACLVYVKLSVDSFQDICTSLV